MRDLEKTKSLLAAARGETRAEKLIRGARVANVFSFEYESADVAIVGDTIVGVGDYDADEIIEVEGVLAPGFIDGHIHIESSMMTPAAFARAAAVRGTTCVMADPHEIANVAGLDGIKAMKISAENLPVEILFGAPSCVPASHFESCKEKIGEEEISKLFDDEICHHLGEMMNFPAVIAGEDEVLRKIAAAALRKKTLTAHAPLVSGRGLCAYILSGCDGDHESSTLAEASEKLRRGFWVMLRQGSSARDLEKLLPLLIENPARAARCMAVSDDISPQTLLEFGHQDGKLRMMIKAGLDPLIALRMITLSPAEYFGLGRVGAIAPGWKADMVLVDSLESCNVKKCWKNGRQTVEGGKIFLPVPDAAQNLFSRLAGNNVKKLTHEDISIEPQAGRKVRAIGIEHGSLITKEICLDSIDGLAKLVVQERHNGTGRVGVGFLRGLGITEGALASSMAHDAHNFIAAGVDDESILTAMEWLRENTGGVVAARGNKILAGLSLPYGGLMCGDDAAELAGKLESVQEAARALGIRAQHPCMALSFLSLSVIPELKLTDRGYIAIANGEIKKESVFYGMVGEAV